MNRIRVVLADDNALVLEILAETLASDFEVVCAVEDGARAIEAVRCMDPDVLVLDIAMPVLDGIGAALQLKQTGSRTRVVFLTVHEDPDFVAAAFSAGVLGYVFKRRLAVDLAPAIAKAMEGKKFLSPSLSAKRPARPAKRLRSAAP